MSILKSLIQKLRVRTKSGKKPKMESEKMAQERFVNHLSASLRGRKSHYQNGPYKTAAERRGIQSRMDRTAHALFMAKVKLLHMRD